MEREQRIAAAQRLMADFAHRTGLSTPGRPPHRYLWTDAYALCTFVELHRATGAPEPLRLAAVLVDQVHETLGRHRADDPRRGWISGLGEAEGREHPTIGGLRIGKPLPERAADEMFDERVEWDRDGQYFHYLTRWMHALVAFARVAGRTEPLRWAVELADTACRRFVHTRPFDRRRRMYWKMSVDLTRPLVPSMGQHDPIDGLVTCLELRAAAPDGTAAALDGPIAELRAIAAGIDPCTEDPLGIGGLLAGALTLARLLGAGAVHGAEDRALLASLLLGATVGTRSFLAGHDLRAPAARRLAFRELGLAIGLAAVPHLRRLWQRAPQRLGEAAVLQPCLQTLASHVPEAERITAFWLHTTTAAPDAASRRHADIDDVMLAAALLPDTCLGC